jgi:predicted  nucleic acid-binding Zn-ribbon protein
VTSRDEQSSNGVVAQQQSCLRTEPLRSPKSAARIDFLEKELQSVHICLAKSQTREEELKYIVDQSRRREGYTSELVSSNKDLKTLLASAQSELDKLWRRERALDLEASALSKALSRREQEISVLKQQVSSISRLLSERDDNITRLETLLGEEQIRSTRNREIAAKVFSCTVCFNKRNRVVLN